MELQVTTPCVTRNGQALAISIGASLNGRITTLSFGAHRSLKTFALVLNNDACTRALFLEKR